MKKFIIMFLIMALALLAGCSVPVDKEPDDKTDTTVKDDVIQEKNNIGNEEPIKENSEKHVDEQKAEVREKLSITLYYQDNEGYLIPVTRKIAKQEGIARAAVNGLIDDAQNREEIGYFGLYPVLPRGTEVLGINIKEGIAVIDFSKEFLDYPNEMAERNVVSSVVYTLTEFQTINGVKILINGYEKEKLRYNTDISGALDRQNVLINSKRANLKDGLAKADIYLLKKLKEDNTCLLPVSVEYSKSEDDNLPGKIVELLGKKNADERLYSEMPEGIRLLDCEVKGSTLTLDFDESILNYGGRMREDGILSQILYSMKQVKGVDKIRLLVEGKTVELPEGTDISRAIPLPKVVNDIVDR